MLPSLLLLLSLLAPSGAPPGQPGDWTAHPLIAHALGGIDGAELTNSLEAFESSYARGFRVFETDLMLTDDYKQLVARHDWGRETFERLGQIPYLGSVNDWNPLSLQTFKELPINGRYQSLDWPDLLNLMVRYPDIYFVLDTKFTDEKTIVRQYNLVVEEASRIDPSLLDRIIPQIYHQKMLGLIDSVHPFSSYIYTLYQSKDTNRQVVDFVRSDRRIKAVAMSDGSRVTKSFIQSLNQTGVKTYVHTINAKQAFEKYRQMGVFGVYTDYLTYAALTKGLKGSWKTAPPVRAG